MNLITPPPPPTFPFTYETATLPNMPEGPEKDAALAWLALPENNPLLSALADPANPDPRPFIASRILDLTQSPGFVLVTKFHPEFVDDFLNIITALAPEYVHGTEEIPPLLTQYNALADAQRRRMIAHLRSLGFPCDGADSLQ